MTDSERVIDDHPTKPSTITLENWKEMKDQMEYLNDRNLAAPCYEPLCHEGKGLSAEQILARPCV